MEAALLAKQIIILAPAAGMGIPQLDVGNHLPNWCLNENTKIDSRHLRQSKEIHCVGGVFSVGS